MYEDHKAQARVQHPLEVLATIEMQAANDLELRLQQSPTPWAELLAGYVQALNELVARGDEFREPQEMYTLDDGHAGGCG
ncbi:DUF6269 family protein [Streptomyces sp. NPDC003011]